MLRIIDNLKNRISRKSLESASQEELIEIILMQKDEIVMLRERIEELEKQVRGKGCAAPFSKNKPKDKRKRPGRRKGEGRFTRRPKPQAKPGDQVKHINVKLKDRNCPDCNVPMDVKSESASIEDTPTDPVRRIIFFEVEVGRCRRCGKVLRARHPDLAPDQYGASAHRVGANACAQALSLHYHSGLPLRKVPEAFEMSTAISISQSALTQKALRLCLEPGPLGEVYKQLRLELQASEVVNTDDTGWRTGGLPSYLMGFFTKELALYQIRDRHRNQEVREMIGEDFAGILGTDRGPSYDAEELDHLRQQKCLSHLLKNLSEVIQSKKTAAAKWYCQVLQQILRDGLKIWTEYRAGGLGEREFRRRAAGVENRLTNHLRDRQLGDADNQRMLDGIGWHHDRGRVLLFLKHPEVEPTNNRAERGLRPAVISRKVSHCSKNQNGASVYQCMKSLTATIKLRGFNVTKTLATLIKGSPMPTR